MPTLVLGGARSGKSRFAQERVESLSAKRVYVATAEALDGEMRERIARHQADRGASWRTVEAATDLIGAIDAARPGEAILIDCLTLWLSNLFGRGEDWEEQLARLIEHLERVEKPVVLVSNEIGLGLVPETKLGRDFRDAQGRLNQRVAAVCEHVVFLAAGLPLWLKGKD